MVIPVIDFSRLDGDDRAVALMEIAAGFEEWGFFQVSIHIGIAFQEIMFINVWMPFFYDANYKRGLVVQLVNTGIPDELLERVKKVCSDCYKLREEGFKESNPAVKALAALIDQEGEGLPARKVQGMDWEDVFTLHDDMPWPSIPPTFK